MWKPVSVCLAVLLVSGTCLAAGAAAAATAGLTDTESRWLKGAWPVIAFARAEKLPLDIVVQPQPSPGIAPIALAFIGGRCKLVLSMRGNAEAQATLERIEPDLLAATLELMAAHEMGHCRRYLDGDWNGLPAGFVDAAPPRDLNPALRLSYADMRATRREEGYADLVALAWTQQHHPNQYARLHAWLLAERSKDLIPGSHHDTRVWVQLAEDATAMVESSTFAGSTALWTAGLALEN